MYKPDDTLFSGLMLSALPDLTERSSNILPLFWT